MDNIIVYTCITNGKDTLKEYEPEEGVRYICFNDGSIKFTTDQWENCNTIFEHNDPRMVARYHKLNPSKVLPEHTWSMWIDGSMLPKVRVVDLITWMKATDNGAYGVRRHPGWNCIYDEAKAIAHHGFEDQDILDKVVARYKKEGFPEQFGMHETGVLIRLNVPRVIAFDKLWWNEVAENSKRDQMSFDYLLWREQTQVAQLNRDWFGTDPNMPFYGHKHER